MSDKKNTEELSDQDLEQVQGGLTAQIDGLKPKLTETTGVRAGIRATDGVKLRDAAKGRATDGSKIRAAGIRATKGSKLRS